MKSLILISSLASLLIGRAAAAPTEAHFHQDGWIDAPTCSTFENANWVTEPIDRAVPGLGSFHLFYTLNHALDAKKPTILFIDGGPGALSSPTRNPNAKRIDNSLFNVVSFHLRGAGCSQLPLGERFDRTMTINNAVEDLEGLRAHLGLDKWDVVLGQSFGAFLAGHYGAAHPESVPRVVEEGVFNPLWHEDHGRYLQAFRVINTDSIWLHITERLRTELFPTLQEKDVEDIREALRRVQIEINQQRPAIGFEFGRLLVDNTAWPEAAAHISRLEGFDWSKFDISFFSAIQMMLYSGSKPTNGHLAKLQRAEAIAIVHAFRPAAVDAKEFAAARERLRAGFGDSAKEGENFPLQDSRANIMFWNDIVRIKTYEMHSQPILYIQGTADGITPASEAKGFTPKECGANCALILVDGGGHSGTNLNRQCWTELLGAFVHDSAAGTEAAIRVANSSSSCMGARASSIVEPAPQEDSL